MSLFAGIEIPGHPDLENVRRLDLLPIPMIRRAHRLGIAIDPPHFAELASKFSHELIELEKDIASYIPPDRLNEFGTTSAAIEEEDGDSQFNAGSAEQIGKLLFDLLDLGTDLKLKRTKEGRISTGRKQLEMIRLQHPVVPKVLRHRELKKLITTYCNSLPKLARFHPRGSCCPVCELPHATDQWRVHGEMGTTRAETGRINHRNPNLGNIPTRTEDGQEVQAGFIAPPGKRLGKRDLSQIELRGLTHLSNCQSMIDVYMADGDLHDDTCHRALGVPWDEKPDKFKHRMAAKRCIAKGQRVLTDRGLIEIENVLCQDKVWDGVEWVTHDGVVSNGVLPTIEHDGLRCTLDHVVWTNYGEMMYASQAKRRGVDLAVTGVETTAIRFTRDREFEHLSLERIPGCDDSLFDLSRGVSSSSGQYPEGEHYNLRVSEEPKVRRRPAVSPVTRTLLCDSAALRESEQRELEELRWQGDRESICERTGVCDLRDDEPAASDVQTCGYRSDRQRRSLRAGEFATRNTSEQLTESPVESMDGLQGTTDCDYRSPFDSTSGFSGIHSRRETHLSTSGEGSSVAGDCGTEWAGEIQETEVFDIVNAGPRHRFTVEGKLVANTNFGIQNGTTEKGLYLQLVMDFGTNKMPIPDWLTEEWCKGFIESWLDSRPEVREYFEQCWYRARRYGIAWEPLGRCRLIPQIRSTHPWIRSEGMRNAQNFPVTSLAAGQLKLGMGKANRLLQEMFDCGVWCWPLLTIHDAIMFEADEDVAEDVMEGVGVAMDTCMTDEQTGEHRFRVPIKSDGEVIELDETGVSRWK